MEKVTYYEHSFNINEWFVLLTTLVLTVLVMILPKIFSRLESIAYFIYGIFIGMFFDHTISVPPINFYDVNDNSSYQVIDFMSYIMYGPYSYLFMYFYVKLKIHRFTTIVYVIGWTSVSILMEWIGLQIGLYHYNHGYQLYHSIPIYLFVQTLQIIIFKIAQKKGA